MLLNQTKLLLSTSELVPFLYNFMSSLWVFSTPWIWAFGTRFDAQTDCKGLELSGCFKSTILDTFLQEWLNRNTLFIWKRKFLESKCSNCSLWVTSDRNLSHVFNSSLIQHVGQSYHLISQGAMGSKLTEIPQTCKVLQSLLSSQKCTHKTTDCFSKCSPILPWVSLMKRANNTTKRGEM